MMPILPVLLGDIDAAAHFLRFFAYFALFRIELGRWVTGQRNRKKKGKISREHEEKLNRIGFVWNMNDNM